MSRRTLQIEVIERHVYQVTDHDVAAQIRQAIKGHDVERLDELITFLETESPAETSVLTVAEVKR